MSTPSDIKPLHNQHDPRPVYVAIYEHPHGMDVRVFVDAEQALSWRTGIAQEWWSNAFEDDPPPDDEIGEEYFERMLERDEFFSTLTCDLEISDPGPADPSEPEDESAA